MTDAEQPEARARVLACLEAAGANGISSHDLCVQANTHAAIRRVWELSVHYGYRIIGSKEARNYWHWELVTAEPWHRDPNLSVREARIQEQARLRALEEERRPVQRQPSLLAMMEAR